MSMLDAITLVVTVDGADHIVGTRGYEVIALIADHVAAVPGTPVFNLVPEELIRT